ncbi:aspartyl protease family protein [Tunicatimonas pelagia]|uniref:aspartyl protease family protein n=1 Tax=Tunicatimonas pelagia TaxID=931531 RepID=UPI0026669048|nr:aspartyl protease family protein [Tunicatimonas pelagia]WKN43181.1 aspartyl protease family protein [Tunicatimonas pelagia]
MKQQTLLMSLIGVLLSGFTSETYEYVKVVNWQYKPIIKVELNGKSAYFLVDTGSDMTILHKNEANRFDFQPLLASTNNQQVLGLSGKRQTIHKVKNVHMVIGSMPIKALFKTYDLSGIVSSLGNRVDLKIAGIIGSDVMKRYGFIIDYQKQTIAIKTRKPAQ